MKKSKLINITKALTLRAIVITHSIILYFFVIIDCTDIYICIIFLIAAVLILIEGAYNILKRLGQEWKWGSPLLFIYILFIYLPSFHNYEYKIYKRITKNNTNHTNEIILTYDEFEKNIVLDMFFVIVMLARWFVPKGKITLEDLSKLLLMYITNIADILDMIKMLRDLTEVRCEIGARHVLFRVTMFFTSLSILTLCMSFTATRNKVNKLNLLKNVKKFQPVNRTRESLKKCRLMIRKLFEKEIWGIIFTLIVKEIPFAITRTCLWIEMQKLSEIKRNSCSHYTISVFFTLKNYILIIIILNRCYVISKKSNSKRNSVCVLTNFNKLEPINQRNQRLDIKRHPPLVQTDSRSTHISTNSSTESTGQLIQSKRLVVQKCFDLPEVDGRQNVNDWRMETCAEEIGDRKVVSRL